MTRNYFHIYPTCPCCHEPYKSGSILNYTDKTRDIIHCNACNTFFSAKIDLSNFTKTSTYLLNKKEEYPITETPLIWKINPNIIEKSYLSWIKSKINGKYLITWPWKEVRFIPLLISEYLLENPHGKILVVGEVNDPAQSNGTNINYPEMNVIFDYLLYMEEYKSKVPQELRRECNRFRERDILKKKERFYYKTKIIKDKHSKNDSEDD